MDVNDKLNLQKMIKTNNVEDNTDNIKKKKHSQLIKNDLQHLLYIKKKYANLAISNYEEFDNICIKNCSFLFNNYTDIFNRIKKDELNLEIFNKFLETLKKIEDNIIDQHTGSYEIGVLLKKIYIDSALKKSEKIISDDNNLNNKEVKPIKNISYHKYKYLKI